MRDNFVNADRCEHWASEAVPHVLTAAGFARGGVR
jgi:hypothetical protein